jgi:hypothetical protein
MGFGKLLKIAAVCVGLYFAGDFAFKKIDHFWRTHKSYSRIHPEYHCRNLPENDIEVKEYMASVEKIPDQLQDIVDDYRGNIIFSSGKFSEIDEFKGDETRDDCAGLFRSPQIFVLCNNADKKVRVALHEYGHAIDEFAGKELFGRFISETEPVKRMFKKYEQQLFCETGRPLCDLYNKKYYETVNPKEFVAESIAKYYLSNKSKKQLRKTYPDMFEFYRHIEKKAIRERGITGGENFVVEDLFDLFMVKTGIAPKITKWLEKLNK